MRDSYKQLIINVLFLSGLSAAILLPTLSSESEARKPIRWRAKKIVVVDPGHGGPEAGSRGPNGVLEKDVTLALAQQIETALKGRFKVQLTRTEDYGLDITSRTDVANHLKSDIFVSIHTGGSFERQPREMGVFYFREGRSNAPDRKPAKKKDWDRLQQKHVKQSRKLAQSLQNALQQAVPGISCQIEAAPLLVLRGADMPSVLVEVGTLSNAEEEKRLNSNTHLTVLSQAIADGINAYLRTVKKGSDQ